MRTYIVSSVLIIFGLVFIAYKGHLPEQDWKVPYLTELGSALLVGGLLSVLFKVFQERQTEANLRRLMRIHDSVDELGVQELLPESRAYNFSTLITDSDMLVIVLNDGLRWVGNNSVSLQERFSKKGKVTEVFTVDPDSPFISSLAQKLSISDDDLKKKIRDAWGRLIETWDASEKRSGLVIFKLKNYPTRSLFLTEDLLVETPYQIASGRAKIPVFIFRRVPRDDSPYSFGFRDIEALRKESIMEIQKDSVGG